VAALSVLLFGLVLFPAGPRAADPATPSAPADPRRDRPDRPDRPDPPLPWLCRRVDSKPLVVGGFSKDRDARRGYATGGKARGYKLFCCWAKRGVVPEAVVLGPLSESDQAGAMHLIDN